MNLFTYLHVRTHYSIVAYIKNDKILLNKTNNNDNKEILM